MSRYTNYDLHGEVHPFVQKSTKNSKEIEESGGEGNPWDQLPEESAKAYSAFMLYLDLGAHNRSQSKLAKIIYGNKDSTTQIGKWSSKYDWVNRAELWDRYCAENRRTQMEEAVKESEDVMLSYLPKVILNLSQVAAGEKKIGRAQMRAVTDFLDRVGPAKQKRSETTINNNNVTVNAPQLPDQVVKDTGDIPEAEIIEEEAAGLIPDNLQNKKKSKK